MDPEAPKLKVGPRGEDVGRKTRVVEERPVQAVDRHKREIVQHKVLTMLQLDQ